MLNYTSAARCRSCRQYGVTSSPRVSRPRTSSTKCSARIWLANFQ